MARTSHPTKIDIPDNARAALVDLSSQMKQAHWNVKGPAFIALHARFDIDKDLSLVEAHGQAAS